MRASCLKAIAVLSAIGVACCGVTYWLYKGPDIGIDLPDAAQLSEMADETVLKSLPPDVATLVSPPGGLFGVPSRVTPTDTSDRAMSGPGAVPPAATRPAPESLEPFLVHAGTYPVGRAILEAMLAMDGMSDDGYRIELVEDGPVGADARPDDICRVLASGTVHAAATTLETVALCAEGARIGVPVGQSLGNDVLLSSGEVAAWQDALAEPVWVAGDPAAAYLACLAVHAAVAPAPELVWLSDASALAADGPEGAGLVAAREPVATALRVGNGSRRVVASSRDIGAPWDVFAFSEDLVETDQSAFQAFTRAYYRTLRELARADTTAPDASADDTPAGDASAKATPVGEVPADAALAGEAFASLGDAAVLMADTGRLERRLAAAAEVWAACGLAEPRAGRADWADAIAPRFVLEARESPTAAGGLTDRPGREDFSGAEGVDVSSLQVPSAGRARRALEGGVSIAFAAGNDEYADPEAAEETLADAVRYLRACADCLVRIQPAIAVTSTAECPDCPTSDEPVGAAQARRVYYDLWLRLGAPRRQLALSQATGVTLPADLADQRESGLRDRVLLLGGLASGP